MKKHAFNPLILIAFGLVTACFASDEHEFHSLTVTDASIRPLLPGQTNTAAFFTISNRGNIDCKLLKSDTPIAKRVEFHTHKHEQGMVRMRLVETVQLSSGDSLLFESGGLHLMLFDVEHSLNSLDSTEINIHTDHCGSVSFSAKLADKIGQPVEEMHH